MPLWSSGQSFWLQIQRSLVRFPALPDFSERHWVWNGVHSPSWVLMSITEELLGRNSSGSGQENREYDRRDSLRWPRNTLYPQKLVLLRQEAAVARSAWFASGPKPRSLKLSSSSSSLSLLRKCYKLHSFFTLCFFHSCSLCNWPLGCWVSM
jgi:hypothetical protein